MEVKINGKAIIVQDETLYEILTNAGYNHSHVIVELDGKIITRDRFTDTKVKAGACLEVLSLVGGG